MEIDCRSVAYLPSVIAAATMVDVINDIEPNLGAEYESQLLGILGIDKVINAMFLIHSVLHTYKFILLIRLVRYCYL